MEVWPQISRQRVKHIVSSYCLDGAEAEPFANYLDELLNNYPIPAVELALVETLVDCWGKSSLPRGTAFLDKARTLLQGWKEAASVAVNVTPSQFHQITGLDPAPVFGPAEHPSTCPANPLP